MSGRTIFSCASVPRCRATLWAYSSSLYACSSKPIETVTTRFDAVWVMAATTRLESMPPGEERAERHVAHETQTDRFSDERVEPLEIFLFAGRIAVAGKRQIPVLANRDAAVLGDEEVAGWQLANRLVHGVGARNVLERQIRVDCVGRPLARHVGIFQQRLDFRSERHARGRHAVVERLDAEAIADKKQPSFRIVPERKGKHAAEAVDRAIAPLFVGVDDDFGIGLRAEHVARSLELGADVGEVVDLAVEDDPDRPVLVGERLIARRQIDDAQTAMSEADAGTDEEAVGVGPAMRDDVGHRRESAAIDRLSRVEVDFSSDAAHIRRPPAEASRPRPRLDERATQDRETRTKQPCGRTISAPLPWRAPPRPAGRRAARRP